MTHEERSEIQEKINKLKEQLRTISMPAFLKVQKLNVLRCLKYDLIVNKNDRELCKEVDEIANELIDLGYNYIEKATDEEKVETYKIIKECYQMLGRRHFKEFMISIEWDFADDMKFYDIRKNVFDDWIKDLEALEYGNLEGLSISAPPRTGKALSLDSNILTPTGWVKMRDIHEGDKVISADGKPAEVLGVFPQGIKSMYKIIFDDETEVKCSGDHMWTVQTRDDRKNKKERVVTTEDMLKNLYAEKGARKNYSIKYVEPVQFENKLNNDDLHPYVVGCLIGDGTLCKKKSIKITNPDKDILQKIEKLLPDTDKLKFERDYDYNIVKKKDERDSKGYPLKSKTKLKLIEYGLDGTHSYDKFIPKKYLYSSIENRIELLRGLMDTDGYGGNISKKTSNAEFSTTSKQLSEDVAELARSLGARVIIKQRMGKYRDKDGNIKETRINYRVYIKSPINPFYCKRKAEGYVTKEQTVRQVKYISAIEKIPDEECQCIYVNHPSHLFVTDGYNLTHNTGIGTIFFMWCMLRHPRKILPFCFSYTVRWLRKYILMY